MRCQLLGQAGLRVSELTPDGEPWCWARRIADALCELKGLAEAAIEANQPRAGTYAGLRLAASAAA